jgi:cell division protein FtsQ
VFGIGSRNKRNRSRRPEGRRWTFALPRFDLTRWAGPVLSLVGVLAAGWLIRIALDQPIQTVVVAGRFQRVSPLDIEKAVRQMSRGQGLIAIDLHKVAGVVRRLPWVDSVTVGRSWPRGLSVHVVEQVPVARWGQIGLLNPRGEVFVNDPEHVPAELPELIGPPGTQAVVTQRYLAVQGRMTEAGLRIARVRLDPRGAWEFSLDNGVVVRLGRRQVDERFERFMAAATRLLGTRAQDIAYIDLRYANGFAVGWRQEKETRSSG